MPHPGAESINPQSTTSGALADYLTPATFGGRRAGRATAMANATGGDPSFNLRHPMTSHFAVGVPAALAGGAAGYFAGDVMNHGDNMSRVGGALLGAGAATLLAHILQVSSRRGEMQDINDRFDRTKKLDPKRPGYTALDVLGGTGGSHRMGQIEALKAMTGGKPNEGGAATDTVRTGLGVAGSIPVVGPVAGLANFGTGIGQGASAVEAEENDPKIRSLKVASVLRRLLAR